MRWCLCGCSKSFLQRFYVWLDLTGIELLFVHKKVHSFFWLARLKFQIYSIKHFVVIRKLTCKNVDWCCVFLYAYHEIISILDIFVPTSSHVSTNGIQWYPFFQSILLKTNAFEFADLRPNMKTHNHQHPSSLH